MTGYRYSRWDGTQDPLPPLGGDAASQAFTDELLEGRGPEDALRRLLQRGVPGSFGGLQSLRERLRRIQERRPSGHLDGLMDEIGRELEEIVETERAELEARPEPEARFAEAVLDSLPDHPAGRIEGLRSYDFASQEAGERFERLLERLREQVLGGYLERITEGMRGLGAEERAALKDMLDDLNRLLEQRRSGLGPSEDEFGEFMRRHGRFFPEQPGSFDELLEALARRRAAMSRLLASMTPEQRAELEGVARSLLDDLDLELQVTRLGDNLRSLLPDLGWDRPAELGGDRPLGMAEALSEIEQLSEMEELEACLRQDYPGARLEDVDPEQVRRVLGETAAADLRRLREIERLLEETGMVARHQGRLELTPRGIRRLGERALAKVFERLPLDRPGSHQLEEAGGQGEPTGSSRPWRFGDPFRIDIRRTVSNALVRQAGSPPAEPSSRGVRLHPDDFELAESETRTRTATVVLLDMSRSMPLRGHWAHAKRMALALQTLIQSRYPEDRLSIVGFSDYARVLRPADLAGARWEPVYGTNMEHAFLLAGRLLAKEQVSGRQVLLVTDGEPTAHLAGDGVFFHWPPVRETLERTYREALRLSRSGATMNIFMLERSPSLVRFVDRLARLVRGRVFAVRDEELGAFVVHDYLARRER